MKNRMLLLGELWHNFRLDSWLAFRVARDCIWLEICNVPMFLLSLNEDGWEIALLGISIHCIKVRGREGHYE